MSRERGNTILVGLKLTSLDGKVERDIICTTAITVFNLHKVIQWSLFPSKGDDTVAATPFTFKYGNKAVKGVKGIQLCRAAGQNSDGCNVGTSYTYQSGNKTFNLVVTAKRPGDAQFYVPRCINGFGGNINLDGTNKKLLVRRFTKAGGRKQYPSVWCDSSITTDEDLMEGYLAAMQEPI